MRIAEEEGARAGRKADDIILLSPKVRQTQLASGAYSTYVKHIRAIRVSWDWDLRDCEERE